MFDYFARLFDTDTLSPHGMCLLWRPELLWTHVVSDALIFSAYMTIPVALAVIIRRRRDIPFGWMVWCFAIFITACGFTHIMGIWTLWHPDYGVEGLVKAVTAFASVATALLLWRLIPLAIRLPSPAQLRSVNEELERRVAERDQAIAELRREQEEREKTEQALLQSQKMDALGQLTGGIAHDFNNLLQAVRGSLELISRRADDPAKVRQLVQGGLSATERGAQLTGKLLAFARTKQLAIEAFFVADMAADMREILSSMTGSTIDLRFDLGTDEMPVLTDRTQAELALLNMVINARDATSSGGRIVVRTERYEATADDADLSPGTYVRLSVADNGVGMAPEVAARAFDPFFTTKPIGQGTGLGLSQVYGVARQTGGAARIESTPGAGSTVSIFIPGVADHVKQEKPAVIAAPSVPALSVTVLMVDDDDIVRATAVESLEVMGLSVQQARSGEAALTLAANARPDLVLLDYAMPGMTGAELAQKLRRQWPDLPIVFITGYADANELSAALGKGETILRKPYRYEELEKALAQALETPSPS